MSDRSPPLKKAEIAPFKAWLLYDAMGTYESTLHHKRACAESEKREHSYLIDAKWRIVRVEVKALRHRQEKS